MEGDGEDKGSELVSKSQQQKGKRGQEQWFSLCRKCGVQDAESARRRDGVLPGIQCEVKFRDRVDLNEAYEQAVHDKVGTDRIPVVAWRLTGQRKWTVSLSMRDLVTMLADISANSEGKEPLASFEGKEWIEQVYLPWWKSKTS